MRDASVATSQAMVLRSPSDIAQHLGTLVGHQPAESIVAVIMAEGQVAVTFRIDLPTEPRDWIEVFSQVTTVAQRADVTDAILVVCTARGTSTSLPHAEHVADLREHLQAVGVMVRDSLLVDGDRWWSYGCSDPHCCPTSGTWFTPVPAPSRSTALEAFQPGTPLTATVLATAAGQQPQQRSARAEDALQAARRISTALTTGQAPQVMDVAVVIVAVQDIHVRDYLAAMGTFEPGDRLAGAVTHAALHAPTGLRPRVAGLAAALHATGPSTLPVYAMVDLAEGQALAELVRVSISNAIPPDTIVDILRASLPQVVTHLLDLSSECST